MKHLPSLTHYDIWTHTDHYFVGHGSNSKVCNFLFREDLTTHCNRFFFAQKFEKVLQKAAVDETAADVEKQGIGLHFPRRRGHHMVGESATVHRKKNCLSLRPRKLRADMVRRLDDEPKPVNPSGWVPEEGLSPVRGVDDLGPQVSQQRILPKNTCSAVDCSNFANETMYVASNCWLSLLIYCSAEKSRRLSEPVHLYIGSSSSGKTTIFLP